MSNVSLSSLFPTALCTSHFTIASCNFRLILWINYSKNKRDIIRNFSANKVSVSAVVFLNFMNMKIIKTANSVKN